MPGREYTSQSVAGYRFGFNGKEKDDEISGDGNAIDFGARIYEGRLGKWLSLDPLVGLYPGLCPYNFALNNPSTLIDIEGMDVQIGINSLNLSYNGIQALKNSTVISTFVNQFTSTTVGRTDFQSNSLTRDRTTYANDVTLSFNSVRKTPATIAAMAGRDAQTIFMVRLPAPPGGGPIPAPVPLTLWNPAMGATGINATVTVLEDNFRLPSNIGNSFGNSRCLAAAYTSIAITSELYSNVSAMVNFMIANTDKAGVVDYVAVANNLLTMGVPPISPDLPSAQDNLIKTNDNKESGYLQLSLISLSGVTECVSTHTTGEMIRHVLPSSTGAIAAGLYEHKGPLIINNAAVGGNNSNLKSTPDSQRITKPSNECR